MSYWTVDNYVAELKLVPRLDPTLVIEDLYQQSGIPIGSLEAASSDLNHLIERVANRLKHYGAPTAKELLELILISELWWQDRSLIEKFPEFPKTWRAWPADKRLANFPKVIAFYFALIGKQAKTSKQTLADIDLWYHFDVDLEQILHLEDFLSWAVKYLVDNQEEDSQFVSRVFQLLSEAQYYYYYYQLNLNSLEDRYPETKRDKTLSYWLKELWLTESYLIELHNPDHLIPLVLSIISQQKQLLTKLNYDQIF